MKAFLRLWLAILFTGCVHVAKTHVAPDATELVSRQTEVKRRVQLASRQVEQGRAFHSAVAAQIVTVKGDVAKLESEVPMELKAEVQLVSDKLTALERVNGQVGGSLDGATEQLTAANATASEIEAKYGPDFLALVERQTAELNKLDAQYAKADKALAWYRLHWFLGIIVTIAGIALCVLFAILKFTGRLAIAGAKL